MTTRLRRRQCLTLGGTLTEMDQKMLEHVSMLQESRQGNVLRPGRDLLGRRSAALAERAPRWRPQPKGNARTMYIFPPLPFPLAITSGSGILAVLVGLLVGHTS